MKYLILFLMLITFNIMANPEIGNDGPIHFVLDQNNANFEYKTDSGQCFGGVVPRGDGTASGEITCITYAQLPPWFTLSELAGELEIKVNSVQMPNTPCELFDSSNNAGNNQGHNVTQYNSNNWAGDYKAVATGNSLFAYKIQYHKVCIDGVQQ